MDFEQELFNFEESLLKKNIHLFNAAKKKLFNKIDNRELGFIEDLKRKNFSYIEKISYKLKRFENIIFLGTGGSSLGGKTLASFKSDFLYKQKKPRIFFIENIDQDSIDNLISLINLKRTAVVVISKSGETLETLAQFFFIYNKIKKKKIPLQKSFFIITENKKSTLKKIQEKENFNFFEHDQKIGGRFSVFSIVGLIPADISGFKIKSFCNGAKNFLNLIRVEKSNLFDQYFKGVFFQYLMAKKGVKVNIFMPYIDSFQNFSLWMRQLWSESVGKGGKGTTLVNALGTVDQHSQLQIYLDGPKDKFFTLINLNQHQKKSDILDCSIKDFNFEILDNKSLKNLLSAEFQATVNTIKKKKLPLRTIKLKNLKESVIGELMMFFFLETILFSYLQNEDPFNQPAVEEGKIITKQILKNA